MKRKGYIGLFVLTLYASLIHGQQVLDTICINMATQSHLAVAHQPNLSYQWSVNGGQILGQTDTNAVLVNWGTTPGLYRSQLVARDGQGCISDTTYAWVFLKNPNSARTKGPNTVCEGDMVTLISDIPSSFMWSGGARTPALSFVANRDTTIMLIALNGSCGNDTVYHPITTIDKPQASISYIEDTVLVNDIRKLYYSGSGTNTIEWYLNGQLISHDNAITMNFDGRGPYELMQVLTNGSNCTDTVWKTVYVDSNFKVWIPNAFSPNGDGINDIFTFDGVGIKSFTAQIYNRWGTLIYEWDQNSAVQGWDGTYKGTDIQMAAYVYKISIEDVRGHVHYYQDLFNIIR